jgi:DNA invertase Pin-like site-specific DNA recombinase
MLAKYAADHGFGNTKFYIDDGTSGTVFNRPGLNAMVEGVKSGQIAVIIFKDQSRIGRDVLEVGLLKRTFEEHNVRYIAASDGLDSANGFDIMSIFRDVFNEFYVSDTSKKIRAVKKANAEKGKVCGKMSYGYIADGKDNSVWRVDEEAAVVIKEAFQRVLSGEGPVTIARDFNARGILSPSAHRKYRRGESTAGIETRWFPFTLGDMLRNVVYVGTQISQRETTISYKNHTKVFRPKEEWVVLENHHPAIIDKETFDIVQKLRSKRREKYDKYGSKGVLSGLLYCADCAGHMRYQKNKPNYEYYTCAQHQNGFQHFEAHCTRHSLTRKDAERIVLTKIQETVTDARADKKAFAARIQQSSNKEIERELKGKTTETAKSERRIAELDKIIKRIYEDNISGRLSDERFVKMLADYESEQSALTVTLKTLRTEIERIKAKTASVESFLKLVDRYSEITELTAEVARTFIEKILVHEPVYKTPTKRVKVSQRVDIYFNHIGIYEQ